MTTLIEFCEDLHSQPDAAEVQDCVDNGEIDFNIDGVRFIASDEIDAVLADELSSDLYQLGCFYAPFIADQTELDIDVIEALHEAEAFEALGKLIVKLCDMTEFADAYASADGYGHHFNSYDGEELEITIDGIEYLVFDNH